jgi:hypothetical protein
MNGGPGEDDSDDDVHITVVVVMVENDSCFPSTIRAPVQSADGFLFIFHLVM